MKTIKYSKIKSCKSIGLQKTIDLEVNHSDHNFYCEGLVTSNSHAVSYAYLAVITAYLKFNYTTDFFAAQLNMARNEQDPFEHINNVVIELPKFGIDLLQPDLAESKMDFTNEKGQIRYGLTSIKSISDSTVKPLDTFVELRKEGTNKFDIFLSAKQAKIGIGKLSALIQAGTLDSLGDDRTRMVLEAQSFNKLTDREKRNMVALGEKDNYDVLQRISSEVIQGKSVGDDGKPLMKESRFETFKKDYDKYKAIYTQNKQYKTFADWYFEKFYLGYSYSHSLRSVFINKSENLMNCEETLEAESKEGVKLVGIIESARKSKSKKDTAYYRFNVVDETGKLNCLFFDPKLSNFLVNNEVPKKKDIVIIEGKKAEDNTVFVDTIKVLTDKIYVKLSEVK
mgnify:FL=1